MSYDKTLGDIKSIPADLKNELEKICPNRVFLNVPLNILSRWRIGGLADIVVRPSNIHQLQKLILTINEYSAAYVVIGSTSNLLFSDDGLRVICIQLGQDFSDIRLCDGEIHASTGIWVPRLARELMHYSLGGAEHICGIPGTLGGLVYMNGGSQRQAIGSVVSSVRSINSQGKIITREQDMCEFGYRQSVFQHLDEVIVEVKLKLEKKDSALIRRDMLQILRARRAKFPQKLPNCGSVFKSNSSLYEKVGPPGAVIESLGLKGLSSGGASISKQHANFINNAGNATSQNVIDLVQIVINKVFEKTGFRLETEAKYVTSSGEVINLDKVINS